MTDRNFMRVEDVARELDVSKSYAYKIVQKLNKELEAKGYITISGRVNRQYFLKRTCYGGSAEDSWRGFRVCFASIRTHLACIFSEIFQENTRKSTKDFLRFSFHLSKNLTAQSAYAQMQNRLS